MVSAQRTEASTLAGGRLHELKHGPRNAPLRKTIVTRYELRAVFKRMLDQRRSRLGPARCCSAPMPFHALPARRGGANWQIHAPVKCARGCDFIIHGIHRELRASYDLVQPAANGWMRGAVAAGGLLLSSAVYLAWATR